MNLRTAARGFVAFLLSVPALQGDSKYWAVTYPSYNVCALRGSTVEIRSNYQYPKGHTLEKTLWYTNIYNEPVDLKDETGYRGRVENISEKPSCNTYSCFGTCTLRIKGLKQSDSADYKFRFITNQDGGAFSGIPGVKLSVTDQVEVIILPTSDNWVRLECHSMCHLTGHHTYTWYKNGIPVIQQQQHQGWYHWFYINSDYSASCAVTGSKHLSSPSVYAPETPLVGVTPSGVIKEGSSVTLTCSSVANPVANYTWTKVTADHPSRQMIQGQQLSFHRIESSDSGRYLCQAKNDLGTKSSSTISIDVKYGPKHTYVRSSPPGEIKEGGSVTLSCSSDANPAANYTWFREHGGSVEESGENYTISNITTERGGNYYCEARNAVGLQNSTLLFFNVTATSLSPSSVHTTVATGAVAVLLATIVLLIFLWMRRKRASRNARGQGGRPDTRQESPPCPVYDNVSALTNRSASAAQREPIEEQDDLHYASIHISRSKNQEVPCGFAGALVKSDHTEQVLYSAINLKRPKAVPE